MTLTVCVYAAAAVWCCSLKCRAAPRLTPTALCSECSALSLSSSCPPVAGVAAASELTTEQREQSSRRPVDEHRVASRRVSCTALHSSSPNVRFRRVASERPVPSRRVRPSVRIRGRGAERRGETTHEPLINEAAGRRAQSAVDSCKCVLRSTPLRSAPTALLHFTCAARRRRAAYTHSHSHTQSQRAAPLA